MDKFKVGDNVKYIKKTANNGPRVDDVGKIVDYKKEGPKNYLVEFKCKILDGHSGFDKKYKDGYCWWCSDEHIELMKAELPKTGGEKEMTDEGLVRKLYRVYAINGVEEIPEILAMEEIFSTDEDDAKTEVLLKIAPMLKNKNIKRSKVEFIANEIGQISNHTPLDELKKVMEAGSLTVIRRTKKKSKK